ncbi:MAG: ABC transporter substrate-binding protein [Haloarculaceae archaeon]
MSRDSKQHDADEVGRRDLMRRFGVGGATVILSGLAGCGSGGPGSGTDTPTPADGGGDGMDGGDGGGDGMDGGDGGDGGTATEEPMAEPVDATFSVPTPRVPRDVHWNNYNPTSQAGPTKNWVQEYMIGYRQADQTFVPSAVFEDVTVEGTTMSITVMDDVTWHSGDPITAEDVVTQVKMDIFMNQPPADVVSDAQAVDDKTAELSLKTKNKQIALGTYAGRNFHTPTSQYGEYVTRFEEATSDSERDSVRSDVVGFEAKENDCGPFTITNATARRFEGEVHEGHPAYEAIQGLSLEVTKTTGNQGILQMGIADEIDYIGPIVLSQDALSQLPDHYQINPTSNLNGHGLFWNHENEHISRVNFRKAIAHVADRKQIAKNAAGLQFKTPVGTPTGISGVGSGIPRSWIGDALDSFTAYETNTDGAAQLLQDAGYSKQGGNWVGPNGNTVKLNLVYPGGWTDWVNAGQTLNAQLQSFGIKTEFQTVDAPTWNGKTFPNGEFDITPRFWGGGRPHPFFGFRKVSNSTAQGNANIPQSFDVPGTVGEPGSSTTTMNLADMTAQIPETSGSEAKQIVTKLAWAVNQRLPVLPVMEKIGAVWWTTDDFQTPPADNKWMSVNPPTHLTWPFHEGKIPPKRK